MRIRKEYYVVWDETGILAMGASENRIIETSSASYAEFNTETELLQFIAIHKLTPKNSELRELEE